MNRFPVTKSMLLFSVLASLLCHVPFTQAQQQAIPSKAPVVACPETNTINICAPVASPAAMKFEDFNPSDDNTPIKEIEFVMEESMEVLTDVNVITQKYTFTDKDGNSSYCEMIYNITNRFMQAPVMDDQNQICQNDFFRGLKLGSANYMIYKDDNGKPGINLGKCDQPGLLCAAENLGIDAAQSGVSKLWVTEFINFPDASICESSASLLNVEVIEKPTAQLTKSTHKATTGTVLNLMDFVQENTSGFWNGEGVYSTLAADGSITWLFSATGQNVSKLYYTVSNFTCSQSYLLLVEPEEEEDPLAGVLIGLTLNFNETKTIAIGNTTITFTGIEDSRCPKEVDCVWEGEAIATLEISNYLGTVVETFQVDGFCFPDHFCFGDLKEILGLNFWLTGIHPYPVEDNNINEDDYMVSLQVGSATPITIDDTINSPLIGDNTTQEEDEAILATTLAGIKAVTEGIPCENSTDWKFTPVAAICFNEYIVYPQQIDEAAFLERIKNHNFAFYEYVFKWNLYEKINCIAVVPPVPISVICENGEAALNYNLLEPEIEGNPPLYVTLGEQFTINYNETKTIATEDMTIKFASIDSDSRCPVEVVCFWGGEVTATLEITINSQLEVVTLTAPGGCFNSDNTGNGPCPGETKEISGYQFKLISIDPYPRDGETPEDADYSVTLIVQNPPTFEEDQAALASMFSDIQVIAESVVCENAEDWKFIPYGSKACGGPQGYIAYATQIDETAFLESVALYTQAEAEFNIKWGVVSTCDLPIPPQSISCVDGKAVFDHNPVEQVTPVSTADLANAQNNFALNIFKEANNIDDEVDNIIISPLSVAIALAMVSNGAAGETLEEFQQVMHLSNYETTDVNAGYSDYIQKLQNLDENLSLEIANAVFYDDMGIVVNPDFIETVEQYYNAQIEVKDFKDEATVTEINDWVKTKTKQKIEKIIDKIEGNEVMFLLNAIYFNGGWSEPFNKDLTYEGNFMLEDGSIEMVDYMGDRGNWEIYTNANLNALNLPLSDSIYNMMFIQPKDENISLKSFTDNFSQTDFYEITTGLIKRDYVINIPKFELSYENQIKDDLINLGLILPFDQAGADLSNLGSAGGNLYISKAIHKTYLKIDEDGATAAAVTGIGIGVTSVPPSLNFNRPFLCLIWEKADNSILFMAKIMNPNAE